MTMTLLFTKSLRLFQTQVLTLVLRLALMLVFIGTGACTLQAQETTFKPGDVFRDCDDCPELVVVPPGLFVMGLGGTTKTEGPSHRVFIEKPFAIGRFEVTFDQWEACIRGGGCTHQPDDHLWGRGTRPVINLNYTHIENYLKWLRGTTGQTYRLPSEAEWEYAHRGNTTTLYPWGNEVGVNLANCKDCKSIWSAKGTAPVGSFPPNAFGLYDTVGNAYEWTADCWNPSHEGAPPKGGIRTDGDCNQRVMRGGSFYYFSKVGRSSYRSKNALPVNSYWLGFRVLRELP